MGEKNRFYSTNQKLVEINRASARQKLHKQFAVSVATRKCLQASFQVSIGGSFRLNGAKV